MAKKFRYAIQTQEENRTLRVYLEPDDNGDIYLKIEDYYVAALTTDGKLQLFGSVYDKFAQVDEAGIIITERCE